MTGVRGSGVAKTEPRQVAAFTKVALEGAIDGDITVGGAQLVELSGDDNLLPLITTQVDGPRLRIAPSKRIAPKLDLVARVQTAALDAISAAGSSTITLRGVAGDSFGIDLAGSGKVTGSGHAGTLTIQISGSGTVVATELHAEHVKVSITGSAEIDLYATQSLDVNISGSGKVTYAGNPPEVHKSITGSGTLVAR